MKRTFKQGVTILDTEGAGGAHRASSGRQGVYWDKRTERYYVRWSRIRLGIFDSFDEAVAIREEAENRVKDGTFDAWVKDLKERQKRSK